MTDAGPDHGPSETALPEPVRVDFYILTAADAAGRLRFACRLTEKAYMLRHRVHLHTESPGDATRLDELLWTFRQGSFVPHEVAHDAATGGQDARSPVTIGFGAKAPPTGDLLINLAAEVPPFAGAYARIAEVVDETEGGRARGRDRFRHYKQLGCEPTTHNIGTAQ